MLDAYGLTKCIEASSGLEYSPKSYMHRRHYTIHRSWMLAAIYSSSVKQYKNLPNGENWHCNAKFNGGSAAEYLNGSLYWYNVEVADCSKAYVDTLTAEKRAERVFGKLTIRLLPPNQGMWNGHKVKSSKHRVEVKCPCCQTWVVFGRFGQHYQTKTCLKQKELNK